MTKKSKEPKRKEMSCFADRLPLSRPFIHSIKRKITKETIKKDFSRIVLLALLDWLVFLLRLQRKQNETSSEEDQIERRAEQPPSEGNEENTRKRKMKPTESKEGSHK